MLGCSGADPGSIGGGDRKPDGGPNADAGPGGAITVDASGIPGPKAFVRVRTTTAPFQHTDDLSGQTTRMTAQGVRSMRLLRYAGDPSPVVLFDHGAAYVEAGYDDGDDTLVGVVELSKLPPGTYTVAQSVVTHSRFLVSSTMHYSGLSLPGEFDCIQALSDGATLEGSVRARGWYRYTFEASGQSWTTEGANAPLPTDPTTGGFTLKSSGAESYYEIATALLVPDHVAHDLTIFIDVNMDHAFRWEDQALPDYAAGVYDTTPVSYEPIRRYGANSYQLHVEETP